MTIQDLTAECTKIAVIGTRGYNDYEHFSQWVKYYTQNRYKICFVSGGCISGADSLIERYASEFEHNMMVHYPDYSHGKRAPLMRNQTIVDSADMLIAFWDGRSTGTAHALGLAEKKGIPIRIVNVVIY